MSHLVETMAFVGATPWHGLGNQLTEQQSLDVWQHEAGMNWTTEQSDVLFNVSQDGMHTRARQQFFANSRHTALLVDVQTQRIIEQVPMVLRSQPGLAQGACMPQRQADGADIQQAAQIGQPKPASWVSALRPDPSGGRRP